MTLQQLQDAYAIPGVLRFESTPSGLIAAHVTALHAEATIYLQGAHLTHWKPAGQSPVLFMSSRSDLAPGKPIRGGVPIAFPWFANRSDGKTGPSHGFARISPWDLAFAAVAGDELHLTFTLAPNELSRQLGFDHFKLAYSLKIGPTLTLELTVANDSGSGGSPRITASEIAALGVPLVFEEALHTYYAVSDIRNVTLTGLAATEYLDKRDNMARKLQDDRPIQLTGTTDRVYLNTRSTCVIHDPGNKRRIVVEKSGSNTTVIWNPWAELAATLPDMDPEAWPSMFAVETVNAAEDRVTLAPGATHSMRAHISIESA